MEQAKLIELTQYANAKRLKILLTRNHDYASGDALSNFQRVAELCQLLKVDVGKPEGVAMFFIVHKLDRVQNLIANGKVARSERLEDSIDDAQNYLDLLRAILKDGGHSL